MSTGNAHAHCFCQQTTNGQLCCCGCGAIQPLSTAAGPADQGDARLEAEALARQIADGALNSQRSLADAIEAYGRRCAERAAIARQEAGARECWPGWQE